MLSHSHGVAHSPQVEPRPPAAKAPGEKCFQLRSGANILKGEMGSEDPQPVEFPGLHPRLALRAPSPVPLLSMHTLPSMPLSR